MIIFESETRIFMAREPIDIRKGADNLASLILSRFEMDPYSKSLFIFCNKRHNRLKCLYFDGTGFWMFTKRIDHGTLKWQIDSSTDCPQITEKQFRWLLEGLKPQQKRAFPTIRYEAA